MGFFFVLSTETYLYVNCFFDIEFNFDQTETKHSKRSFLGKDSNKESGEK